MKISKAGSRTDSATITPPVDDFIFKPQPGDPKFLDIVKYSVNQFRLKFPEPTGFQFDPDVEVEGEHWYKAAPRRAQGKNGIRFTREALASADIHMYKAALLHAAITNAPDDTDIGIESLKWAIQLAEYLQAVTTQIYSSFNLSEERRLEQRIIDLLTQKPNQTARELQKHQHTLGIVRSKCQR